MLEDTLMLSHDTNSDLANTNSNNNGSSIHQNHQPRSNNINIHVNSNSLSNTNPIRNCGKGKSRRDKIIKYIRMGELSRESTDDDPSDCSNDDKDVHSPLSFIKDHAITLTPPSLLHSSYSNNVTSTPTQTQSQSAPSTVLENLSPIHTLSSNDSPTPISTHVSAPSISSLLYQPQHYVYVPTSPPPTSLSQLSPMDMPIWSPETNSALISAIATNSFDSPDQSSTLSDDTISPLHMTPSSFQFENSKCSINTAISRPGTPMKPLHKHEFSAKSWHATNTVCLLNATDAIDACCRTVVKTSAYFSEECVISVEARRLALTIAVFERALYAYAVLINTANQNSSNSTTPKNSLFLTLPTPSLSYPDKLLQRQPASTVSTPTSKSPSSKSAKNWHQPAGLTCLLEILTKQLLETQTVLKELNQQCVSFPAYCKSVFTTHIVKNAKSIFASPRILGLTILILLLSIRIGNKKSLQIATLGRLLKRIIKKSSVMLESKQSRIAQTFTNSTSLQTMSSLLPPFLLKMVSYSSHFFSPAAFMSFVHSLITLRSSFITTVFLLYVSYKWRIVRRARQLRKLHSRLGFLLRLWHICFSLVDQPQRQRTSSSLLDSDALQVPISRWMLELVPPELEASFWYSTSRRLSFVKYVLNILYCSVNAWYDACGPRIIGIPYLFAAMIYYGVQPSKSARRASRLLAVPNLHMIRHAWHLLDTQLARLLTLTVLPRLGFSPGFIVCKEVELHDDEENDDEDGSLRRRMNARMRCISENDIEANPPLRVLICAARQISLSFNYRFHRISSLNDVHEESMVPDESPIILYCHSGGWITDFTASHLYFLQIWAERTKAPIIYVRYSLAPENAYPAALNEIYEVYKRIVSGRIGLRASKIFITGDSTGGNLAAACCMRAIMDKIRIPDRIVLAYPILNLRSKPTPSRALYMSDAVLPMNLLMNCRTLYAPSHCDPDNDPCLSPIVASDELLAQWPTTCLMAGSFDPFVDDVVDFAHRLVENGVEVRLKIFDSLPHSFFDFAPVVPQAARAVELAAEWLCDELDA